MWVNHRADVGTLGLVTTGLTLSPSDERRERLLRPRESWKAVQLKVWPISRVQCEK